MAVDCHLDGMAIEVLEHVDPLLGGKDTLKKKVQNQKGYLQQEPECI